MSLHGDDFVAISWVCTLPGYRNIGVAGSLIQEAEREAINHGKKAAALGAYPGAVGAYKRAGFREYCRIITLELIEEK